MNIQCFILLYSLFILSSGVLGIGVEKLVSRTDDRALKRFLQGKGKGRGSRSSSGEKKRTSSKSTKSKMQKSLRSKQSSSPTSSAYPTPSPTPPPTVLPTHAFVAITASTKSKKAGKSRSGKSRSSSSKAGSMQIQYDATVEFLKSSSLIPSALELDNLMMAAFQLPAVQTLLLLLGNLPEQNPFSSTGKVAYSRLPRVGEGQIALATGQGLSVVGIAALVTTVALVCAIGGACTVQKCSESALLQRYKLTALDDRIHGVHTMEVIDSTSDCSSSIGGPSINPLGGIECDDDMTIEFGPNEETRGGYDPLFQAPFRISQGDLIR
ncbi:predicted protein [Phaeodactylum tricornutum CCAP 1055/1]|uniref:Uncharacterized protein n=2 Tax=Phaeodactylum tricornutum TaxID=2850 RepID=B7G913_PHATC|nr:predicted protein [Phaeodactylum tricornutum CCAP 1055/1]EEC44744.1 predicted protein [Phaeodactylum tricornutum CCAP 1055/1]|eukprot:XP_002183562.1 predicted protein [Phaeodactylum tricornutum CCAP 1055/1]